MKKLLQLFLLAGIAGCAYPASTIDQGTPNGFLRVSGLPEGALVTIDGVRARPSDARTANVFATSAGRHRVQVRSADRVLIDREYMVGAGSSLEIAAP